MLLYHSPKEEDTKDANVLLLLEWDPESLHGPANLLHIVRDGDGVQNRGCVVPTTANDNNYMFESPVNPNIHQFNQIFIHSLTFASR